MRAAWQRRLAQRIARPLRGRRLRSWQLRAAVRRTLATLDRRQ